MQTPKHIQLLWLLELNLGVLNHDLVFTIHVLTVAHKIKHNSPLEQYLEKIKYCRLRKVFKLHVKSRLK